MALTTSGQIDLNAMHVEAGGTSGTECTLNDADIRNLIGKGSAAQSAFNEFYGASALDTTSRSLAINVSQASGYDQRSFAYTYYYNSSDSNFNNSYIQRQMTASANGLFSLHSHYYFHPANNFYRINEDGTGDTADTNHNERSGIGLIVCEHNSNTSTGTVTSQTEKLLQPASTGTTSNAWRANGFEYAVTAIDNAGDVYVAFFTVENFSSSQTNQESWHVIKLNKNLSIQWAKKWEMSDGLRATGPNNSVTGGTAWGSGTNSGIGKAAKGKFLFKGDDWFLITHDNMRTYNASNVDTGVETRNFVIKGSKSSGSRSASVKRIVAERSGGSVPYGSANSGGNTFVAGDFTKNSGFDAQRMPTTADNFSIWSGTLIRMDQLKFSDLTANGTQHNKFKGHTSIVLGGNRLQTSNAPKFALDGKIVFTQFAETGDLKTSTTTRYMTVYDTSGNVDSHQTVTSTTLGAAMQVAVLGAWGDASDTDGFLTLMFTSGGSPHTWTGGSDTFDRNTTTRIGVLKTANDNNSSNISATRHTIPSPSFITMQAGHMLQYLDVHPEDHEMFLLYTVFNDSNDTTTLDILKSRYKSVLSVKRSDIVYNTTRQSFAQISAGGSDTIAFSNTTTGNNLTGSTVGFSSFTPNVDGSDVSSLWTINNWSDTYFGDGGTVYSKRFSA